MSNEALKVVAASALYNIFSSGKASAPITSTQLLIRVITTKSPPGLLPNTSTAPRFRLTDLSRFESILESFSPTWEHGTLSLSRENGELTVMDVSLLSSSAAQSALGESLNPRKRKRVVDEEADSAAGDDDAEDTSFDSPAPTTLGSLSKELREVYALMQKGTAKGRLLAEQVRPTHTGSARVISYRHSFTLRMKASSPSARTSQKTTAPRREGMTKCSQAGTPPRQRASAN